VVEMASNFDLGVDEDLEVVAGEVTNEETELEQECS
jgi:hypothetical protein